VHRNTSKEASKEGENKTERQMRRLFYERECMPQIYLHTHTYTALDTDTKIQDTRYQKTKA